MSGYNSISYIISDMQKCIADISECHERVMTSFNQSMGEYYRNVHNIARQPSMYNSLETRMSLHYAQMYHHSQFLNRAMGLVERTMDVLLVPPAGESRSQPDISGNISSSGSGTGTRFSARPVQDPIGTPLRNRNTESFVQEMIASIIPPQPIRRVATTTNTASSLLSLLTSNPLNRGSVYEFETVIPILTRNIQSEVDQPESLTYQQINEYTELVAYNTNDSTMTEHRCPITYEDFTEGEMVRRIRHCQHYFKDSAITGWLHNTRGSCPVCRHILQSSDDDEEEEE
jgi:hypothetical protein